MNSLSSASGSFMRPARQSALACSSRSWEDYVPDGRQTDFRRAVAAKEGEKIVFTWQVWPDRDSFQAAEARMHEDPRMDAAGEPPFDAGRLILGCFQPVVQMGRA